MSWKQLISQEFIEGKFKRGVEYHEGLDVLQTILGCDSLRKYTRAVFGLSHSGMQTSYMDIINKVG